VTANKALNSVVIVGAGGFGREVLEIFKDQNKIKPTWDIIGFVDDSKELHGKKLNGYPVLGGLDWLEKNNKANPGCVCAIGQPEIRKKVVSKLKRIDVKFYNAVHPSVIMSELVKLGEDVIISAGSILTVNIQVGDHVHIDTNCSIAHDVVIGSYCRLSPGVKINGCDRLGEGVFIGSGATLVQEISVGNWSTVGAGAVVTEDVSDNVIAVGIPARVVQRKT
jgi:sugar O-acyltransferase (sialic acid O-acetyltransferase NeuD family)